MVYFYSVAENWVLEFFSGGLAVVVRSQRHPTWKEGSSPLFPLLYTFRETKGIIGSSRKKQNSNAWIKPAAIDLISNILKESEAPSKPCHYYQKFNLNSGF